MFSKREDVKVKDGVYYNIYSDRGLFVGKKEKSKWHVIGLDIYETLDDSEVKYVAEINKTFLKKIESLEV